MRVPQNSPARKLSLLQLVGAVAFVFCITDATTLAQSRGGSTAPDLGPNVLIFTPSMSTNQIQTAVQTVTTQQLSNQFGSQRYALLFAPGTYGTATAPLQFQVGFYTDVQGLGASPNDVVVNGSIDVYNQCDSTGCNALDNFWRSLSNLSINVTTPNAGCYTGEFWAVSQASPLRRVNVNGNMTLMDYCTGPSYASGGFIADSITGPIVNGSQQQFFVRNSNIGTWSNAVWNQVFSGVVGAPAQSYPNPTYTTLPSTPVSREKPYLYIDGNGKYNVFVPTAERATTGNDWTGGSGQGYSKPIASFFIVRPGVSVDEINLALLFGKSLIITPGVYNLDKSSNVLYPNTIVLGLGLATIVPQTGRPAMTIADVGGVQVAGLIFDAGPVRSDVLLQVGPRRASFFGKLFGEDDRDHSANPTSLNDVYFRIGGATLGTATTSLEVNSNNVILDNIWAWRADHGAGAAWTVNKADHGLVVNADNVTATGLAVEHYQKEQVLWSGNGGETIFYQSELPYDPPSQSSWTDGAANGYASYVVANNVKTHQAYGLGIYSFFNHGINIIEDNAMTVPQSNGIAIHDAGTVFLNGSGQITHVINGTGGTVSAANSGTVSPVVTYP
ncbi:coagulation factor 5/8 type domain-containing protein [Granulicella aggregans]|nr:coagulation factor 5/8 type domain-containing protein [Granulicella aggregans]